jgi:hypothetical protein
LIFASAPTQRYGRSPGVLEAERSTGKIFFWIFEKIPTLGSDTPWGFYLQVEIFFVLFEIEIWFACASTRDACGAFS